MRMSFLRLLAVLRAAELTAEFFQKSTRVTNVAATDR